MIQQLGSPVELYRKPRNRFAAGFLGGVNFIPCTIENRNGADRAKTGFGEFRMENGTGGKKSGTLLIRPEAVTLAHEQDTENVFTAEFDSGTFLGERSELQFKTADGTILDVTASAYEIFSPGKPCRLKIDPRDLILLED